MTVKVTKGLPKEHSPTSCHLSLVISLRMWQFLFRTEKNKTLTIHKLSNFQSNTMYNYYGLGTYMYYGPYLDYHQAIL